MTTSTDTHCRMPAERERWNEVIALFYESAGSFASQQDFVVAMSRLFDAEAAAFVVWVEGAQPLMRAVVAGLDSSDLAGEFKGRAAADNLFHPLQQAEDYSVISGRLGRRQAASLTDRNWLAGVMQNDATSRSAVLVLQPVGAEPLGRAAEESMRELLGYLKRGIRHNRLFERYRHTAQAGAFLMDRAMRGILLFSPLGAITYRNAEAQRILDDGDGIRVSGTGLDFSDGEADQRFCEFLAGARAPRTRKSTDSLKQGLSLRVGRPSGKSPYQLLMYRLPTGLSEATIDQTLGLVACMIHDPDRAVDLSGDSIRQFFKLTPAETNLAIALLRAHRLPDAAKSLGISINTARTQLKSIFHKLGVNSQPAMMQRLTQTLELRNPPSPGSNDHPAAPDWPGRDA